MAGIEHSKEMKVAKLAHGSSSTRLGVPCLVFSSVELVLGSPLGGQSPCLTTSPVADPILVARVDENLKIGVVEHVSDLGHKVGHPVSKEVGVDETVALNPLAARDTESSLDVITVKEDIGLTEVVAEGRGVAWNTDVVNVKLGLSRVADDSVGKDLAELESSEAEVFTFFTTLLLGLVNESLASFEATSHNIFPFFC